MLEKADTLIEEMEDSIFICPGLETTKNNSAFRIDFSIIPEDFCNLPRERIEQSLMVLVSYKGFSGDQINKIYQLKFSLISENGEKNQT